MPPKSPAEPWRSFLDDLSSGLDEPTELHCIGGFAVVQAYELARATVDIDVPSRLARMGRKEAQSTIE